MPGSVVAYYQQVGRAGRALDAAYGILLSGQEESGIIDYLIRQAFPTRQEVAAVLAALENAPDGLSVPELLGRVNLGKGRIDKTIALLSLEEPAPIARQSNKWQLTAARLSPGFWERAARITALRRDEYQQMQDYVSLPFGQHMAFLVKALGGTPGEVAEPVLPPLTATANARLIKAATAFLHHIKLAIEPRTHWPDEGMPRYAVRGFIAPAHQAEPGRALCVWGTAGWGSLVQQGKYQKGYFCDKLIAACVNMIGKWKPQPGPTWVTCIPSQRYPHLVPQFAQRLALALNLPFHDVITKTDARPEQKTMENSTQQARNIDGSLALDRQSVLPGPVLLVDDTVNSRWTLTVAAWLLRTAGSGAVWPMALSQAGCSE